MLSKIYKKIIDSTKGKKKFQYLFQVLHNTAISGMNYGNGGDFMQSGEEFCVKYVKEKLLEKQNSLVIFDVGANKGHYSNLLSKYFSNEDSIYAFEPSENTFKKLKSTNENNKNVKTFNIGFGSESKKLKLFTNADSSGLASVYQRRLEHFDISMDKYEEVEISTLDSFCKEQEIKEIDFLKLDVEGHELEVLKGAKTLLENKKIEFIQFEFGGANIDSRTFFQDFYYLLAPNYHIYRILIDGLQKIDTYDERQEVFNAINYLAQLKK